MNNSRPYFFLILLLLCSKLFAAGEPLYVGVTSFTPPFVMQGAKHEIYGFDVDMMNSLCTLIQRTCVYQVMRFDELLPSVVNNKIDLAVSSITITQERAKYVDFSMPYLLSYSRFLTLRSGKNDKPFNLELVQGKGIGVVSGTIFADQIKEMGIINPNIVQYARVEDLLEALNKGSVDFILVDNSTALYWEANSAGAFQVIGEPLMYGYGYGIPINHNNQSLLTAINNALNQYQASKAYKQNYNRYIYSF